MRLRRVTRSRDAVLSSPLHPRSRSRECARLGYRWSVPRLRRIAAARASILGAGDADLVIVTAAVGIAGLAVFVDIARAIAAGPRVARTDVVHLRLTAGRQLVFPVCVFDLHRALAVARHGVYWTSPASIWSYHGPTRCFAWIRRAAVGSVRARLLRKEVILSSTGNRRAALRDEGLVVRDLGGVRSIPVISRIGALVHAPRRVRRNAASTARVWRRSRRIHE